MFSKMILLVILALIEPIFASNSSDNIYPQIYSFGGRDGNDTFLTSVSRLNNSTGEWQTIATMPTGRNQFCGAAIGTKFYLFGGFKGNHTKSSGSKTAVVYDCLTNTFTRIRSMPQRREGCGAAVLNGSVYVAGGWDGTNSLSSVIRYDVHTDQWSTVSSMNTSRVGLQLVQLGGYLFAIGGKELNTVERYDLVADEWLSVASIRSKHEYSGAAIYAGRIYVCSHHGFEVYDLSADQWSLIDSPNAHAYSGRSLVSMNGQLWAIGGIYKSGDQLIVSKSVFSYSLMTDKWTRQSNMDVPRKFHVSLTFDLKSKPARIYTFGGQDSNLEPLSSAIRYDSESRKWESINSLFNARTEYCGTVVDDKIYLFGGFEKYPSDRDYFQHMNQVEVYDTLTDTYTELQAMPNPIRDCGAAVMNEQIYIAGGEGRCSLISAENESCTGTYGAYPSVIRYDIKTDQWSKRSSMTNGRIGLQLVELNGLLYAIGGMKKATNIEVYNATADQWSLGAKTNYIHNVLGATAYQGKIYIFSWNGCEVFDPQKNEWSKLRNLHTFSDKDDSRNYGQMFVNLVPMNGKLWSVGGYHTFNQEKVRIASKFVYTYEPATSRWMKEPDMDVACCSRDWKTITSFVTNVIFIHSLDFEEKNLEFGIRI